MPNMDGYDCSKAIKEFSASKNLSVSIIALTAYVNAKSV